MRHGRYIVTDVTTNCPHVQVMMVMMIDNDGFKVLMMAMMILSADKLTYTVP